jgi:hypothetical protein
MRAWSASASLRVRNSGLRGSAIKASLKERGTSEGLKVVC